MANKKKHPKAKVKKLSPEEIKLEKLKKNQEKEIRDIFKNMGFTRLSNIDGKQIVYKNRTSEMDDIFICENIILITEYTIANPPGSHIKNKILFYNKVLENTKDFIKFLKNESKLTSFENYYKDKIKEKYSVNELKLKILYCSKFDVKAEHKDNAKGVFFFDFHIVQYFKSLTKIIKRSSITEFLECLGIPYEEFSDNILRTDDQQKQRYLGHILPEEKSSFKQGYKIVSFYIDAESLIRRSFVLRQEGWRDKNNIGYYQRMLESKKISSMRKYLSEKDRVFINNIIATISADKLRLLDSENNELTLNTTGEFLGSSKTKVTPAKIEINDECNIIGLIDGQHRTFAYHEGDDIYEDKIKSLRKVQNLLVTGIIFPKNEKKITRLKFEANLFLEINSNQTNVKSQLRQEIELMINPYSSISIGKRILKKLNESGPFENIIQQYSYENGKLKTASIVSFGLRPLIKLDENSHDSLFYLWNDTNKLDLKETDTDDSELLEAYIDFASKKIRDIFVAIKSSLDREEWQLYNQKTKKGLLNVTFFNGILNVLRCLIKNKETEDNIEEYCKIIQDKNIKEFRFKSYKSSQYSKMGQDIYDKYFKS